MDVVSTNSKLCRDQSGKVLDLNVLEALLSIILEITFSFGHTILDISIVVR